MVSLKDIVAIASIGTGGLKAILGKFEESEAANKRLTVMVVRMMARVTD